VRAEASDENVVGLKLGLAATGSLEGRVVVHTKPKAAQLVAIVPAGNVMVDPDYAAGAVLRGDSFHFDGLLPGSYRVSVSGYSRTADANLRAKEVVISAGETTVVTLDEKLGSAAVRFTAKGAHGTFVKSVQLMVIAGHHDLRSGKSFGEQIYAKGGNYRSTFLADGESTEIDGLVAGPYTICLVPVDGDYRDAEFVNSMTDKERDELVFHCNQLTLAANETYVHKVKVPALEND
jgi:hypothetical protein